MSLTVIDRPIGHKSNALTPAEDYPIIQTFGSVSGSWAGITTSKYGTMYCAPWNSAQVLKINPDRTYSTFGTFPGLAKYWGACAAPNGMIYCAPWTATTVLKIDPSTDTATQIGSVPAGSNKYAGPILAPNGMIYCIPYNSTNILKIDPTTDTLSFVGAFTAPRCISGSLALNGKIYCIPDAGATLPIFVIDTATDTTSTFGSFASLNWSQGSVMAYNNKIYGSPYNIDFMVEVDPATDTFRTFKKEFIKGNFGACVAPNGKIYFGYDNGTANRNTQLEFDTRKLTFRFIPIRGPVQTYGWSGLTMSHDGRLFGAPISSNRILEISRVGQVTPEMYTMPENIAGLAATPYNIHMNHI